jgi:hypothetical protein
MRISETVFSFLFLKNSLADHYLAPKVSSEILTDTMTSPIPQPPGIPILGNIFNIDQSDTWGSLRKLAEKYGS